MFDKPFYLQETKKENLWKNAAIIFGSLILVAIAMFAISYLIFTAVLVELGIQAV